MSPRCRCNCLMIAWPSGVGWRCLLCDAEPVDGRRLRLSSPLVVLAGSVAAGTTLAALARHHIHVLTAPRR